MNGRDNSVLSFLMSLFQMDVDTLVAAAEAGCTVDHDATVRMDCEHCGWHEHVCPSCSHVWDHDARVRLGSEEDYERDHQCPKCRAPQRMKRMRHIAPATYDNDPYDRGHFRYTSY